MKNLPEIYGSTFIKRLVRIYSLIFSSLYGFSPKVFQWGLLGKQFKQLLQVYSEYQIAVFIILHFEWRGADGRDDFIYKKLSNACFPIQWIFKNVNSYEAYARNVLQLDFDNEISLAKFVDEKLRHINSNL